jgi:WbqC-like protein family
VKKVVVIHQPDFLPWLGFFDRLAHADLYIALDHVQFVSGGSRSWTHRDRIKTPAGPHWLSLSVQKAPLGTSICDMYLSSGTRWREQNLDLLRESYRKAPYFGEIFPRLEALYGRADARLVDINIASIELLQELLDTRIPRLLSSSLAPQGASNEMLGDLLRKTGATHYLSGLGARAYFDARPFASAGVEVIWQEFRHPVYPQLHGGFVPDLSAVDLLFNCGAARSRDILRSG